jgi:quinohemoprotein ethanol dehydrogenase
VLFDAEIDGEDRKGLGEASKTGWVYLLDRETGEPLLPIEDEAVPQLGSQATAKTQPIPSYPPLFSHEVTDEDVAEIQKLADSNAKAGEPKPKVVKGGIYVPFGETITAIVPGPQGGTNWQPSSYNPETGLMYVCAMRSVSGYSSRNEELPEGKRGQTADLGSVFTTTGFGAQEGYFVAIDVTTGEKVWEKRWPESCYSGSVTTGGGLVFVGRNGGQLEAYDAESGDGPLWSFQTGAGANTTATVFEQDGLQYLAFLAGGNALAATTHGDNLWLFSLEGTMEEAKAGTGAGEGTGHAGQAPAEPTDEVEGDPEVGGEVWANNCAGCHGLDGRGANGGPNLVGNEQAMDAERVHAQVTNGGGGMPAFKDTLSAQEIADVTAYVTEDLNVR